MLLLLFAAVMQSIFEFFAASISEKLTISIPSLKVEYYRQFVVKQINGVYKSIYQPTFSFFRGDVRLFELLYFFAFHFAVFSFTVVCYDEAVLYVGSFVLVGA